MNLSNSNILVTGGTDGYGRGIAAVLVRAGARVTVTGRSEAKLDAVARELGVRAIKADVASGADWDRVLAETGPLDALVNNAGSGGRIAPVAEQTDAEIESTIATNLVGAMLGCRRVGAQMAKRGRGTIVNVSSVCALYAWPGWSIYTAAKAGLAKFSHGLYTELRPHGVRVTCLTPSWGQTGFNKAAGITGASEDPALASKCTAPEELGELVKTILETPDHLAIPDVVLQPMVQAIEPM